MKKQTFYREQTAVPAVINNNQTPDLLGILMVLHTLKTSVKKKNSRNIILWQILMLLNTLNARFNSLQEKPTIRQYMLYYNIII